MTRMPASTSDTPRPRILFVGEAVTLAHIVRPMVLCRSLPSNEYQVAFACDARYLGLFDAVPQELHPLETVSSQDFIENLAKGRPVYDAPTLRRYVEADRELLDTFQPDLVVGDFRISLGVSARLAGIPYVTITNAYWSPYSRLGFPLPEHPLTRVIGVRPAEFFFQRLQPMIFAMHARPMNRVRREYGLPSLGHDLRTAYSDADVTLYADIPEFIPTAPLPENHQWLGPILWSPEGTKPEWWEQIPEHQPIVYVALGSSGQNRQILPRVLEALARLPVTVMAATAGSRLANVPDNAYVADFLPGTEAAAKASLVICNGGSLSTQQALAAGVPVLGIADNMDQHLNMSCMEREGVGIRVRAGQATADRVHEAVSTILTEGGYRERAANWAPVVNSRDSAAWFASRVPEWLSLGKRG